MAENMITGSVLPIIRNGNMTKDLNNGIENIEYNVLNLPKLITFANGGTIRYTYSATGEKLKAEYTMTSDSITKRTDYCGNLIYEQGIIACI